MSSSERGRAGRVLAASVLLPLVAFFVYSLVWRDYAAFLAALDHSPQPFADFARYYYETGRTVLQTKQPTQNFLYSPFFALLMVPFGALRPSTALVLWALVQVMATWLLLFVPALYLARRSEQLAYAYIAVACLSHPVLHNFRWGQVSVLVTLPVLLSAIGYARGRKLVSAVLLALSASVKFYTGYLSLYFLFRRDLRSFILFALVLLACALLLPSLVLGSEETWMFYALVREMIARLQPHMKNDQNTQYLANVVVRLSGAEALRSAAAVLGYAIAAGAMAIVWRLERRRAEPAVSMMILLLLVPFLVTSSWPHYFVFLPFCQMLAWSLTSSQTSAVARHLQQAAVVVSAFLSSMLLFGLVPGWSFYVKHAFLFLADALMLGTLCWQALGMTREAVEAS